MQKRIYRSKNDRIIAGICGGLAKYFEIDPAIVRIVFLLLFFFKGIGLLAYLIMWIVIPTDPYEERVFYSRPGGSNNPASNSDEKIEEAEIIEESDGENNIEFEKKSTQNKTRDNRYLIGVVLIIIGVLFLLSELIPSFSLEIIAPVIFIALGAYLLLHSKNEGEKQ